MRLATHTIRASKKIKSIFKGQIAVSSLQIAADSEGIKNAFSLLLMACSIGLIPIFRHFVAHPSDCVEGVPKGIPNLTVWF
jgi:hypothetical protein